MMPRRWVQFAAMACAPLRLLEVLAPLLLDERYTDAALALCVPLLGYLRMEQLETNQEAPAYTNSFTWKQGLTTRCWWTPSSRCWRALQRTRARAATRCSAQSVWRTPHWIAYALSRCF